MLPIALVRLWPPSRKLVIVFPRLSPFFGFQTRAETSVVSECKVVLLPVGRNVKEGHSPLTAYETLTVPSRTGNVFLSTCAYREAFDIRERSLLLPFDITNPVPSSKVNPPAGGSKLCIKSTWEKSQSPLNDINWWGPETVP